MISLLIAIIYMAFISLGLPDSLLGSAWPTIQPQLGAPNSYAGIISAVITCGTIISSVFSNFLTKKLGAGLVTAISVAMTAVALLGFSLSTKFFHFVLWAIPYGVGAGAIDAALNNYVALHFSSKHMNWLHAFWGVGASVSPYVMSASIQSQLGWQGGYRIIFYVQIALSAVIFLSLPLWRKKTADIPEEEKCYVKTIDALKVRGVWAVLVMFFCYCAMESTLMLWSASYLVEYRQVDSVTAASLASLFFIGIMAGRFICGFFSNKMGDNTLIMVGAVVVAVGIVLMILPVATNVVCFVGLVVIGIGCAPVYPAIIHSTPNNFGKQNSQAIIGIQMACAYAGSTLMPLLFGVISQSFMGFFPYFLAIFLLLMTAMHLILKFIIKQRSNNEKLSQSI